MFPHACLWETEIEQCFKAGRERGVTSMSEQSCFVSPNWPIYNNSILKFGLIKFGLLPPILGTLGSFKNEDRTLAY